MDLSPTEAVSEEAGLLVGRLLPEAEEAAEKAGIPPRNWAGVARTVGRRREGGEGG